MEKKIIESIGLEYLCEQRGLILFNDPVTRSTLTIKKTELSEARLHEIVRASRKQFTN